MIKYFIAATLLMLMSACAHPPVHEPVPLYKQNIVKDMKIPTDKSRVVFFLEKSEGIINISSKIPINIFIDGKLIGNIGRYSDMVVADLVPGKHTLSANGMPEYDSELGYIPQEITVNLIAGEQYFYRSTLRDATSASQETSGILPSFSTSTTYSVSLEKDDQGADDLSSHTVVILYDEAPAKQPAKPVKQATEPANANAKQQNVGNNVATTPDDIGVKMRKIKEMYEQDLITQSEYDSKRKTLLENY